MTSKHFFLSSESNILGIALINDPKIINFKFVNIIKKEIIIKY